jgi:hypothetical protein
MKKYWRQLLFLTLSAILLALAAEPSPVVYLIALVVGGCLATFAYLAWRQDHPKQ